MRLRRASHWAHHPNTTLVNLILPYKEGYMQKKLMYISLISFSLVARIAHPSVDSGPRDILKMGCHLNDSTCYVYVSGDPVGNDNCRSTSIRWDKQKAINGKETLSLLMMAFTSKKKVRFRIVTQCYGKYPTFSYINIIR